MRDARARAGESFAAIRGLTATITIEALDHSVAVHQVWYRRPGHWRIEDATGLLVLHTPGQHVARGADGKLRSFPKEKTWYPMAEIGNLAWGDPDILLDAAVARPDPALDPPEVSQVAGRAVHRETFDMSRKRCTLWTDAASGLLLAQSTRVTYRSDRNVYTATVTRLQLDEPLPDSIFQPVPEGDLAAVNRTAETQEESRLGQREGPDDPRVVAAVLRDGDQVLLCHRSAARRWYPNVWDLPGGHVEPAEFPAAALVRELREELGIEIREPSHPPLAMISIDEVDLWVWLIHAWDGTVRNAAPDEHDDLAWLDRAGLARLPLAHPSYVRMLTDVLSNPVHPDRDE